MVGNAFFSELIFCRASMSLESSPPLAARSTGTGLWPKLAENSKSIWVQPLALSCSVCCKSKANLVCGNLRSCKISANFWANSWTLSSLSWCSCLASNQRFLWRNWSSSLRVLKASSCSSSPWFLSANSVCSARKSWTSRTRCFNKALLILSWSASKAGNWLGSKSW